MVISDDHDILLTKAIENNFNYKRYHQFNVLLGEMFLFCTLFDSASTGFLTSSASKRFLAHMYFASISRKISDMSIESSS